MGHKKEGSRADRQSKNIDPMTGKVKTGRKITSQSAKQIRARARRKQALADGEWDKLYKPIEDWDMEELARGRPRDAGGGFRGKAPTWISREVHEQIVERFRGVVRGEMQVLSTSALRVFDQLLDNDEVDEKGKPIVAWSTKLDAAKFLIEHQIGKAVQPVEADISVKLQGILGMALVNPADADDPRNDPARYPYRGASPSSMAALTGGRPDLAIVDDDEDEASGE